MAHYIRKEESQITWFRVPLADVNVEVRTLKKFTHVYHLKKIKIAGNERDNIRIVRAREDI